MRAVQLESPELDAYGQMAFDEAMFEAAQPDTVVFRVFRWPGGSPDAPPKPIPFGVTFGYFQGYADVAAQVRARGLSITFPIARRLTGGGIVYHDGDLTFSVVFPWSRLVTASWVYKDLHRAVHLGLKAYHIPSRLWSPPECRSSTAVSCFSGPSPMDLVHEDGTKFMGGALRRRHGFGLYQGSLRTEGFSATRAQLARAVTEGLSLQWKTIFALQGSGDALVERAKRLRAERYASDDWNKRR